MNTKILFIGDKLQTLSFFESLLLYKEVQTITLYNKNYKV
jgi:hypothetical protein